jgi:2-amino-4-hydroxy-6-hydroxymethyldihydropteridine diphosphokinase
MNIIILLGSNLGNRLANLKQAIASIASFSTILQQSNIYQTAAWGNTDQADFLNQAIEIQTNQTAENLMHALLAIESQMGRVRLQKWEPRIIDLDIIFYESAIHTTDFIQIPHPEMQNRAFVLKPLLDLIPHFEHPILKQNITQLWEKCPDQLEVSLFVE